MLDKKTMHDETTMLDLEAEGKGFEPSTHYWASDFESDRWPIRIPSEVDVRSLPDSETLATSIGTDSVHLPHCSISRLLINHNDLAEFHWVESILIIQFTRCIFWYTPYKPPITMSVTRKITGIDAVSAISISSCLQID